MSEATTSENNTPLLPGMLIEKKRLYPRTPTPPSGFAKEANVYIQEIHTPPSGYARETKVYIRKIPITHSGYARRTKVCI